jgi:hypothetical protein
MKTMEGIRNVNEEHRKTMQELLNQWALSVFQRLEREHPEVLDALLNEGKNKEVQLDQRRKNKTSKRTSGEIQKSSS